MLTQTKRTARRARGAAANATERTHRPSTDAVLIPDGFLHHHFDGILIETSIRFSDKKPDDDDPQAQERAERSFYDSLWHLADLYKFDADTLLTDDPFPLWIATTTENVQHWFASHGREETAVILTEIDDCPVLATCQIEETGSYDIHWIEVEPYWLLDLHRKRIAPLVAIMYGYLWKRADVDYFLEEDGSFMGNEYEVAKDFINEEIEEYTEYLKDTPDNENYLEYRASRQEQFDELTKLAEKARTCRKTFAKAARTRLSTFGRMIEQIKPANQHETDLVAIARGFRDFYQKYPDTNLDDFDHVGMVADHEEMPYDEDEGSRVCVRMATAFVWDHEDPGADGADQTLRSLFDSGGEIIKPRRLQVFNQPHRTEQLDTGFIKEFFPLIERFITTLHNFTVPLRNTPVLDSILNNAPDK